jgi:hypothetical protein
VSPSVAHPSGTAGARARTRDDDGLVTAEWALAVAVLLVPVLLLAAVLPSWAARREAAGAAAREAARVAAAAPADGTAAAVAAARTLLTGRGIDPGTAVVTVDLPPAAARDGVVSATVALPAARAVLPLFGEVTAPPLSATHVRRLDPYRSAP